MGVFTLKNVWTPCEWAKKEQGSQLDTVGADQDVFFMILLFWAMCLSKLPFPKPQEKIVGNVKPLRTLFLVDS